MPTKDEIEKIRNNSHSWDGKVFWTSSIRTQSQASYAFSAYGEIYSVGYGTQHGYRDYGAVAMFRIG